MVDVFGFPRFRQDHEELDISFKSLQPEQDWALSVCLGEGHTEDIEHGLHECVVVGGLRGSDQGGNCQI